MCALGLVAAALPLVSLCAATPSRPHACSCCPRAQTCCCTKEDPGRPAPSPSAPQPRTGGERDGLVPEPGAAAVVVPVATLLSPSAELTAGADAPPAFLTACSFRC